VNLDFGVILDVDGDLNCTLCTVLNRHDNLSPWSLGYAVCINFSKKCCGNLCTKSQLFQLSDRETKRQIDQSEDIACMFDGSKKDV